MVVARLYSIPVTRPLKAAASAISMVATWSAGELSIPVRNADGLDDLDQFTQEFRLASSDDLDTTWQIGAYYFDGAFDITTLGPNGGFPPPTTVRHENELWAVFGQVSHQATERLQLSGGLRYTSDEKSLEVIEPFGRLAALQCL